ncbi:MAG: pyruvate ferredoxin oxidoreductase [Clostridiales Family XIII bacterium]|jgi:pyruvate ferredoxin oxidoreductase beta subunit|nr:pyruvate ferredoxin oxidoreductase [Clostridiales Family XIII bacterium]
MAYQAYSLKEVANKPERLAAGHRMCAGCGSTVAVRAVLRALKPEDRAVITLATSCLEVSSMTYPYTSWEDSYIHTAFENAAATASGAVAAYRAKKKKGQLDETYKFITFGGDGGTYDIGFQSLSGAMERGTDMVYVCYDNEAYMNTGIQRSSSTPLYADTTTSAVGAESSGKAQYKKDLTQIMAAHRIPYVAQSTFLGNFKDLHHKAETAIYTEGPAFLNVMAPCPRGWRYDESRLMEICKAAVETCVWPLFEVVDGEWVLNYEPKQKLPVTEYLKLQGRFKHLFQPGMEPLLERIQDDVDHRWEELKGRCEGQL